MQLRYEILVEEHGETIDGTCAYRKKKTISRISARDLFFREKKLDCFVKRLTTFNFVRYYTENKAFMISSEASACPSPYAVASFPDLV